VSTKALNQAVKRKAKRFPKDFMFRLSQKEKLEVVTKCDHLLSLKFSPNMPFAFTEHGAVMVASVLNSESAIEVSTYVVRAFVGPPSLAASVSAREVKDPIHEPHFFAHLVCLKEQDWDYRPAVDTQRD